MTVIKFDFTLRLLIFTLLCNLKKNARIVVETRCYLQGNYNHYECAIEVTNAKPEDSGEWTCHMEEYYRGGNRGDSAQVNDSFNNYLCTARLVRSGQPSLWEGISSFPSVFAEIFLHLRHFFDKEKSFYPSRREPKIIFLPLILNINKEEEMKMSMKWGGGEI